MVKIEIIHICIKIDKVVTVARQNQRSYLNKKSETRKITSINKNMLKIHRRLTW